MTGEIQFRDATEEDVPAIAAMLADDVLGKGREDAADIEPYRAAFRAMQAQRDNIYVVAVDAAGTVVGCLQYTLVPGLSLGGATRAHIEGVRIDASQRGGGLGKAMFEHIIGRARRDGAVLMQLDTNLVREDARRFYERLGFIHSHAGMKLPLR